MHTSRELAEWAAYEREYGAIDSGYQDEALAQIHELLQAIYHITCQANSEHGRSEGTEPKRFARPGEIWTEIQKEIGRRESFDA